MNTDLNSAYAMVKLDYSSYLAIPIDKFAELISSMKVLKEEYANGRTELLLLHDPLTAYLSEQEPRPEAMKPADYQRTIAARAFDAAGLRLAARRRRRRHIRDST